jgi:glucan-binding YG repeat protein
LNKKISGWFFVLLFAVTTWNSLTNLVQAAENGWAEQDGSSYYYSNEGPVKGWYSVNNDWYYFNPETSAMQTGWLYDGSTWYYLSDDGTMKTGWLLDNGSWYFLNPNGAMRKGWLNQSGNWYYLQTNGVMKTGWFYDSSKWYFLRTNGAMKSGWLEDKGNWYFLDSLGVMKKGWILDQKSWYYLNQRGVMETGWIWLNNEWSYFKSSGAWVKNTVVDQMDTIWDHDQLILVTADGYATSSASIRTFEQIEGKWYEKLNIPGYIGKYGFANVMSEGGKESPRGKYSIGTAFGRYDNPGTKLPFRKITSDDVWVDDPSSALYNTWQKASANNGQWNSAERMDIPEYNYGFVINYNTEKRVPGAGSAIFFHVSDGYTLGCTATSQNQVISILKWLDPAKKPIIIQAPESELGEY